MKKKPSVGWRVGGISTKYQDFCYLIFIAFLQVFDRFFVSFFRMDC